MTKRERSIVIGSVLGDGFLQRTGKNNARLRLEHSQKQKEYIFWKWRELERFMQDKPKRLERFNPVWKKNYSYYRCQSHSGAQFGKLRDIFYGAGRKRVPEEIAKLLSDNLALAVWFMDDGYYYVRDRTAYIYLSKLTALDVKRLSNALAVNFKLYPRLEKKKSGALNFKFSVKDTKILINLIAAHVVESMRYKISEEPRID